MSKKRKLSQHASVGKKQGQPVHLKSINITGCLYTLAFLLRVGW